MLKVSCDIYLKSVSLFTRFIWSIDLCSNNDIQNSKTMKLIAFFLFNVLVK